MRINLPILLVEDDLVDIMTTRRALDDLNITNPLIVANDGEEALLLLGKEEANKPGIIILDINMPRMNGIELLKHLKNDEELKRIPVVVLTISKEEEDKIESFSLGVAGYMIKPVDYLKFVEVIRTIDMY